MALHRLEKKLSVGELLQMKAKAQNLVQVDKAAEADEAYTYEWALNPAEVSLLLSENSMQSLTNSYAAYCSKKTPINQMLPAILRMQGAFGFPTVRRDYRASRITSQPLSVR